MWMNRPTVTRLTDIFTMTDGIFAAIATTPYVPPWQSTDIKHLDIAYYTHSGDKIAGSLPLKIKGSQTVLTAADKTELANVVLSIYGDAWKKIWETYIQEYGLLDNTDVHEEYTEKTTYTGNYNKSLSDTYGHTVESSGATSDGGSSSDTKTTTYNSKESRDLAAHDTGTDGTTAQTTFGKHVDTTAENNTSVYAFNSDAASPSDKGNATGSESHSGVDTTQTDLTRDLKHTDTGDITHSGTDTDTINHTRELSGTATGTETHSGTDDHKDEGTDAHTNNITHTLTRRGNIGVTTAQQMLTQERQLRMDNFIFNYVFPDLDRLLCLQVY